MLTNRIKVTFDMENIDNDFDIFRVEKANKDYNKNNILDSALYDFKAVAVQWVFGATALVLFRKGDISEKKFKENIIREYADVRIQKVDLFNKEQCEKTFYYENRLLAQLLFNSMHSPKHNDFRYNNLTGKLFYHDSSWNKEINKTKFIRFLEVVIDPGMYLNLEHKTFKSCDGNSPGLYVIDKSTGEFRRKLKTDVNTVTYKKGSLLHKHFRVDNFNITNYEKFKICKLGIMEQFLRDVKENLSQYLTIEFVKREGTKEFEIPKLEKKNKVELEYGQILSNKRVVIIDENKTEKSAEIVRNLTRELEMYCGVKATIGKLSKDAYNIRIIHSEQYYIENNTSDPHTDDMKGYIVQHALEESDLFSDSKGMSPAIKKIVQELIIKGDVREKTISVFDWKKFNFGVNWAFVLRHNIQNEKVDGRYEQSYNYYRLQITADGNLMFDSFCDKNPIISEDWKEICFSYDLFCKKNYGSKNQVDGLIYSDIKNIHAILLTKEKTIPNIAELYDTLKQTNPKDLVSKKLLLEAIEKFECENQIFKDIIYEWKCILSNEANEITKANIKKILNMRTNCASMFNRFFHEEYRIWIDGELRKNEFEATYQIGNLINIKYEYNENDYTYGNTFVYYVGEKSTSKKTIYPNSCCIRKVIALGDEIEYKKLLPLMAVEFVRNSQYTVVPFPFKYLREYIAQS